MQLGKLHSPDGQYYLEVYGNSLSGTLPPQLANINALKGTVLHLESNSLSGTIPPAWGKLALQHYMQWNDESGAELT